MAGGTGQTAQNPYSTQATGAPPLQPPAGSLGTGGTYPFQANSNSGGSGLLGGLYGSGSPQFAQAGQSQPPQQSMNSGLFGAPGSSTVGLGSTAGGLGGIPAPMQNPFMGGQGPSPSSVSSTTTQDMIGGGSGGQFGQALGQLGMGGQPPRPSSVNSTTTQDMMGRGGSGGPFGQAIEQQMQQLQQKYMSQPPQVLQQMQQQLQQTPEFQAMQKAVQSGNMQEADRLRNAFEATPQFQQMRQAGDTFNLQQQQAQQKMMADPRFNQLQNQMQELQQRQQQLDTFNLQQQQAQQKMMDLGTAGGSGYYAPQGQPQPPTSRMQRFQSRPQPSLGIGSALQSLRGR